MRNKINGLGRADTAIKSPQRHLHLSLSRSASVDIPFAGLGWRLVQISRGTTTSLGELVWPVASVRYSWFLRYYRGTREELRYMTPRTFLATNCGSTSLDTRREEEEKITKASKADRPQ